MKAKELAKLLGVSPATISLVLNNKPGISDSLRESLLKKIQALGCEEMMCPSCRAGEAPGTSSENSPRKSIVYLSYYGCSEWGNVNSFYPGILEGAESEARSRNYDFSVFHMKCQQEPLERLLCHCENVIGFIVQADALTPEIEADLKCRDVPSVFIDIYDPEQKVSAVRVDNLESMHTIVGYLKEKGHREIGYVYSSWDTGWQANRYYSFRSSLHQMGLDFDETSSCFCAGTGEDLYEFQQLADRFSQAEKLPTALVCENDRQALRAINALHQIGLQVPKDISVVGFDDSAFCNMIHPRLTTARNSSQLMGRECVMLLENLRRLQELGLPTSQVKYDLSAQLVERDSVRDLNQSQK